MASVDAGVCAPEETGVDIVEDDEEMTSVESVRVYVK